MVFLNLIILSAARLNWADSFEMTFSLVGIIFVIMNGIIFYHFYLLYIAKSALWLKFTSFLLSKVKRCGNVENESERSPLINQPTKTVVSLREPLMEEN